VDKRPESVENDRLLWTSPLVGAVIAGSNVDDLGGLQPVGDRSGDSSTTRPPRITRPT
jgi:hypothetical protein